MQNLVLVLQLLLLPVMVALAVLALRTSRARRSRHHGYLGLAFLTALSAALLALVSLSLVFSGDEPVDPVLGFLPPALTLAAGVLVARRGLADPARAARRG